jgi:hypothetical protein
MDDFLYELAYMKYRMWNELFKIKSSAYSSEECLKRIEMLAKYDQLLDIINLLPQNQKIELREIEQEYFSDAPYVS